MKINRTRINTDLSGSLRINREPTRVGGDRVNALKQRITNLAQKQFGDTLRNIRFSGPFEDEDLDVDIILQRRIKLDEIGKKLWNISHPIRKDGYDLIIGYELDQS